MESTGDQPMSDGNAWNTVDYAVVDLEGNGFSPPDLVELGIVAIDGGDIGQVGTWLVRPDQPISRRVTGIHGIANADVADSPRFEDVKLEVLQVLSGRFMVAHNASVDWDVLHRKLPELDPPCVVDTLRLAKALFPGRPSYKLADLLDGFDLHKAIEGVDGAPHRAGYDALAALHLFLHLVQRSPRGSLSVEEVRELGELPSTKKSSQGSLF